MGIADPMLHLLRALPESHPIPAPIYQHQHRLRCYEAHVRSGLFIFRSKVSISRKRVALLVRTIDDRSEIRHLVTTVNQANYPVSEPHSQSCGPASDTDLADDATLEDFVMDDR